ncbi:MAG TPA: S41 family peptidase [Thermoanaerobaculia bacterium]|nr:S41 family peptidase [Thermoanaerobaculia bacterium]
MVRRLIAVALFLATTAAFADDARTARLETLCRVWAAAKYTHPAMLTGKVDWDGALVRAIPAVRAAATPAELAAAIDAMLKELHDPVTHVVAPRPAAAKRDVELMHSDPRGVLVIEAGPYMAAHDALAVWTKVDAISDAIARASDVRLDLTMLTGGGEESDALNDFAYMPWSTDAVPVPGRWTAFYSGYDPQIGGTSGGYYSALMLIASKPLAPAEKSAVRRITFVTDGLVPLPAFAVALVRAKKATVQSPLPPTDAASTMRIDLGGGYAALIRSATYDSRGAAPSPVPIAEDRYEAMSAPDLPHRLLAAFRIWSVIDRFYPYKALIGDWDAVLREFIPRFEDAEGAEAYEAAVLEMTAHVEDGHTSVGPLAALAKFYPPGVVPVRVRWVENEFVVVEKYDANAPLSVGDVIVSVDGEPLDARVKRLRKYAAASTEPARMNRIAGIALRGPVDAPAQLVVRGAGDVTRTVAVPRVKSIKPPEPSAPPYRVLPGNIGYADLRLLKVEQVDAMFEALMATKAIIFDMRGYPNGTAWSIAPRINTRHALYGSALQRAQLSGASTEEEKGTRYAFLQALPETTKPLYTGKIVVLIDNRAISQAEHTCLFFEQAAGATFVGSPTAGANGDVTNFVLPGGLVVYFTGHDIRHADGRQLQRVGIQPDIRVEPTIAGLRAGRDEVLDRAVAYVNDGK